MGNPVIHFEIGGRDAERMTAFYTKLFDWKLQEAGPDYWLVSTGGEGIGGGLMQSAGEVPPYVTVYVGVDDLRQTLEQATELGAKTLVSPTTIPGIGEFALIADPEGNTIGVMHTTA